MDKYVYVPEGQMKRLREAMQTERRLLIALHHGPFGSDGTPDRRSHGLVNCDAFLELLRDAPRGTILLHGHTHHQFVLRPEGLPVMVCAGSANHAGRESMWMVHLLPGEESRVSSGHWDGERFSFDGFVAV